jgi:hypothetical protein
MPVERARNHVVVAGIATRQRAFRSKRRRGACGNRCP